MALASYNNLAVTAALPDIGDALGRVSLLPWVVTVELLAAAIAVLAVGPFIDNVGPRRAFELTLITMAVSSGLCAVAPTMELLVVFRVLQGFGTGALISTCLTSIGLVFNARTRPWMYAVLSSVWGIMGIAGPSLAAILVSTLGWRAVFAVNLPVAAAAAVVGWRRLPGGAAREHPEPTDVVGLLLMGVITTALLLGVSDVEPVNAVLLGVGVVLALIYWRHARGHPGPVVRTDHFTGRQWWSINITATLSVAGGTGASVFLPLYLRGARAASEAEAAFSVLWPTLGWSVAAWVSGKLQMHLRAPAVALIGSVVLSVGGVLVTAAAWAQVGVAWLYGAFFMLGWGIGTVTTATMAVLQAQAADHEMGRVSSAHQFLRSLGFAYGAQLSGLVLFGLVDRRTGDVESVRNLLGDRDATVVEPSTVEALADAYTWSLGTMAVVCLMALPVALVLAYGYNSDRICQD